jgi:hypothetical protein
MGSLSGSTFLIFIILCPGFLFFSSFYAFGRLKRADNQHGAIFDAAAFVAMSTVIHLVVGGLYFSLLDYIFSESLLSGMLALPAKTNELTDVTHDYGGYFLPFMIAYFFLVAAVAAWSGYLLIKKIEDGTIETTLFHGPYYQFIKGKIPPVTIVSVLTTIVYSNRSVIYEGIMDEISFLSYRRINSIAISVPERFLLKVKDDTVETSASKYHTHINEEGNLPAVLIIPGDKIANVVFRPYGLSVDS